MVYINKRKLTYVLTCKKQYFYYSLCIEDIVLKWFFHCGYFPFLTERAALWPGTLNCSRLDCLNKRSANILIFIPASVCMPSALKFCFFKFKAKASNSLPSVKPSILRDLHVIWWGSLWYWDPIFALSVWYVVLGYNNILHKVTPLVLALRFSFLIIHWKWGIVPFYFVTTAGLRSCNWCLEIVVM